MREKKHSKQKRKKKGINDQTGKLNNGSLKSLWAERVSPAKFRKRYNLIESCATHVIL